MEVHEPGGVAFGAPSPAFARPQPRPTLAESIAKRISGAGKHLRTEVGMRRNRLVGVLVVVTTLGVGATLALRSVGGGAKSVTVDAPAGLPLTVGSLPLEFGRPADPDPAPAGSVSPSLTPTVAPGPASAPPAPSVTVVVHAAGAVTRPGIYRLAEPARVDDVVSAAGGLAADADPDVLNLAARVGDGERIYVPRRGQASPGVVVGSTGASSTGPASPTGDKAGTAGSTVVDLNTATLDQLDTLPGVGPAIATRIIDARTRVGRFRSVNQLLDVPGIGEAKFSQLRARVKV
jgi:competence protein ComEA